jgi:hypothetical protein
MHPEIGVMSKANLRMMHLLDTVAVVYFSIEYYTNDANMTHCGASLCHQRVGVFYLKSIRGVGISPGYFLCFLECRNSGTLRFWHVNILATL